MNRFENFLISFTQRNGFQLVSTYSLTIDSGNKDNVSKIGFGYGFFVRVDDFEVINNYENEYIKRYKKEPDIIKIDDEDYYALYWGKAAGLENRLNAHLNKDDETYEKTGAIGIVKDPVLNKINISFAAVLVNDYEHFEKELRREYAPILGTNSEGKTKSNKKVEK